MENSCFYLWLIMLQTFEEWWMTFKRYRRMSWYLISFKWQFCTTLKDIGKYHNILPQSPALHAEIIEFVCSISCWYQLPLKHVTVPVAGIITVKQETLFPQTIFNHNSCCLIFTLLHVRFNLQGFLKKEQLYNCLFPFQLFRQDRTFSKSHFFSSA